MLCLTVQAGAVNVFWIDVYNSRFWFLIFWFLLLRFWDFRLTYPVSSKVRLLIKRLERANSVCTLAVFSQGLGSGLW